MPEFGLILKQRGHDFSVKSGLSGSEVTQFGIYNHPTFISKDGKEYMYLTHYFGEHMAGVYEIKRIATEAEMEIIDKSLKG